MVISRGPEAWLLSSLLPSQGHFPSICLIAQPQFLPLRAHHLPTGAPSLQPVPCQVSGGRIRSPGPSSHPTPSSVSSHQVSTLCTLAWPLGVTIFAAKSSHVASCACGHLLATFPPSSGFGPPPQPWPRPWQPRPVCCGCKQMWARNFTSPSASWPLSWAGD